MTYHAHIAPNGDYVASDDDLPGVWSHADFEGGDPDERSYAERQAQDPHTDWGVDIRPYIEAADQAVRDLAALYAHQSPAEGTE